MVHSYLTIPLCMDHLRLAESTLTLCVVITLIHCMVALTMQFQLMLQTVLINKWLLYYNVVEVSDMNTYSANDSLSYTHSDNTRCPGYSTSILLFSSYGRNQTGFYFRTGRPDICVSSRQEYHVSICNDSLSELLKNSKSI